MLKVEKKSARFMFVLFATAEFFLCYGYSHLLSGAHSKLHSKLHKIEKAEKPVTCSLLILLSIERSFNWAWYCYFFHEINWMAGIKWREMSHQTVPCPVMFVTTTFRPPLSSPLFCPLFDFLSQQRWDECLFTRSLARSLTRYGFFSYLTRNAMKIFSKEKVKSTG